MNYCTYYGQYIDPQLEVRICLQCLSVQGRLVCPHKIKTKTALKMKAPDKLEMTNCDFSDIGIMNIEEEGVVEYIRKDLVEHIILGALGSQDVLNKIRSI